MRPVSEAFRAAVTADHRMVVRVAVLKNDAEIDTLDEVLDGTVTLDAAALIRGRCDITISDDGSGDLVPSGPQDLLAPYGNELRIYRGVEYAASGFQEFVSLGIFRIDNVAVVSSAQGLGIQITGQDRAAIVTDARFEEPFQIAAGTNVGEAITSTLRAAWPYGDLITNFATTSATTPPLIAEEGTDRWEFCTKLARSAGMRLYFDGDGILVLAPEVTSGQPAVALTEGLDGVSVRPVLTSAGRQWGREGAFNRVIATGENTGEAAPVRGVATDDDPTSPTYYFGTFGKVPRFYSSPFLMTNAQAADAAASILARELGTTQKVECGTLVLPHLEPGDIARITRHLVKVNENHILDSLTIPLSATGTMTCGTRAIAGQVYEPLVTDPGDPIVVVPPSPGSFLLESGGDDVLLESSDRVMTEA